MPPRPIFILFRRIEKNIRKRFSLLEDRASGEQIDQAFRSGVELSGTTPWVLVIAIFIASIGLDVNSTAVIIGAMLISPLMGPIMGVGYGLGIYDSTLVKRSLVNIGVAAGISLITSTAYFFLSPLVEAQSELLARTSPTIWDVLIAILGGVAGAIGFTRREKSNLIPGVAIATALMPPLCTAGYGLAHGQASYFIGAFYLFAINSVFIAIATMMVTQFLKLNTLFQVDVETHKKVKRGVVAAGVIMTIPSLFLAYNLVSQEVFKSTAQKFLRQEFHFPNTHIADLKINPHDKVLEVTLIGEIVSQDMINTIKHRLPTEGLSDAKLFVHQGRDQSIDWTQVKESILSDVYRENVGALQGAKAKIIELEEELKKNREHSKLNEAILEEIRVQYPESELVAFSNNVVFGVKDQKNLPAGTMALIRSANQMSEAEFQRLKLWLRQRSGDPKAEIFLDGPTKRATNVGQKKGKGKQAKKLY